MDSIRDILLGASHFNQHRDYLKSKRLLQDALAFYPDNMELMTAFITTCYYLNDYVDSVPWVKKLRHLMGSKLTPYRHMMVRQYIRRVADWTWYDDEIKWLKNHLDTGEIAPFYALGLPLKLSEYLQAMKAYYHHQGLDKIPTHRFDFANRSFTNRKIRIGFVSANWRGHPEMTQTPTFYRSFDPNRFQVYFYDLTPPDEKSMPYKQKIIQISPKTYKNVAGLSDTQLADLIFFDQIDILVDIVGLTQGQKIGVFIQQPAPIQVSWLGYAETLGAIPGYDYIIADSFVVPPNKKAEYPEKVLYLEPSYYPYDEFGGTEHTNISRKEFGLPEQGFVYACFGNDYKITPHYFVLWMRLLKQVPGSVLWLQSKNEIFTENLKKEAQKNGVDPERLIFAPFMDHQRYMCALKCADLILDTEYYNLHTMGADALFVGAPVLTCPGERWVARVGGSILRALDLPELIVGSVAEYEEKAIYWGTHPKELSALKQKVMRQVKSGNFFNSSNYARKFEDLCQEMIQQWGK